MISDKKTHQVSKLTSYDNDFTLSHSPFVHYQNAYLPRVMAEGGCPPPNDGHTTQYVELNA